MKIHTGILTTVVDVFWVLLSVPDVESPSFGVEFEVERKCGSQGLGAAKPSSHPRDLEKLGTLLPAEKWQRSGTHEYGRVEEMP